MKKLLSIIAIVAISLTAIAQPTVFPMASSYSGVYIDTVTNTGSGYVQIKFDQTYSYISIQPELTKISGTLTSNSNVKLQGSVDGVNYVDIAGDTMTVTNVSTAISKVWTKTAATGNPYYWYRVSYTGVGTMSAALKAKILFRK